MVATNPFLPSNALFVDRRDSYALSSDIDEFDRLSPEFNETYKSLLRALRRKKGFGLFFVQSNPAQTNKIIKALEKDLLAKTIQVLQIDRETKTLYDRVAELKQEQAFDILCVKGLENALYDYEDTQRLGGWSDKEIYAYNWKGVPPILSHLNQQRERFSSDFPVLFIFFVSSFVIDYFVQRAPDFFDWRSGLFRFPVSEQEFSQKLNELTKKNLGVYVEITPEERIKKLLEIQDLISEPDQSIEEIPNLYLEQSLLFLSGNQYTKAIKSLTKVIEFKPEDSIAWMYYSIAIMACDRYEEALVSLERAITLQPDNYTLRLYRGLILIPLERYDEALADFDKAIQLNPDEYTHWMNRGSTLAALGRYEEALINFDKAVELNAHDYLVWYNRGNTLVSLNRHKEALADFSKAVKFNPTDYIAWSSRGSLLHNIKRYQEALDNFDRAVKLKPDHYRYWRKRGNTLVKLERYEEALVDFDKALQLNFNDYESWRSRGNALLYLNRCNEALIDLDKAIELNPDDFLAWHNRGVALAKLDYHEKALADFDKAINLDPEDSIVWYNRGQSCVTLERYQEALANFNQAVKLNPYDSYSCNMRGHILAIIGHSHEAIYTYKNNIKINRKSTLSYHGLARLYYLQNNSNLAIDTLISAIDKKLIDDSSTWNNLGFLYLTINNLKKAESCFNLSLQRKSHCFHPIFNLGLVRVNQKKPENAKRLIKKSLNLCERATEQDQLYFALCQIILGHKDEGLQIIQDIIKTLKSLWRDDTLRAGVLESTQILAESGYFPGMERALEMFQQALSSRTHPEKLDSTVLIDSGEVID